ncbi:hypothetical protein GCM10010430_28990 [Kitasatospora cystarginea]|uniref:HTH cro/C1-type domain-containing protein n=1 Tax=Kitasatospora cystarginea TaxID=58350 RepID=A0ABP5QYM9_9ACTN
MPFGPTAETVAGNLRRIRELRGLSTYELSVRLTERQRPISPSALAKIERGERRVDVDDLAALAVAIGVNPSALLLPPSDDENLAVAVTGAGRVTARAAWDWVDGLRPLVPLEGREETSQLDYELFARPEGRRRMYKGR